MPTITLKNVPKDLHRRLTERAERNRRSLNQEVIRCLEDIVAVPPPSDPTFDRDAFLAEVKRSHDSMRERGVWLTDELIRDAIDRDRDESDRSS